mgnify:CR=1 FL=1
MGGAGIKELLRRRERFNLVTLARPSAANKLLLRELEQTPGVRIVWGDLTCYDDVLACVTGADIVLHPAAMIAPAADHDPEVASAWLVDDGRAHRLTTWMASPIAAFVASMIDLPCARNSTAAETRSTAFFAPRPISTSRPIWK